MNNLTITEPYLENINDWIQVYDNQKVETELLFEDDYGTKSFIAGVYDKEMHYITVKILRMFPSGIKIETKEDLIVSCDLDVNYTLRGKQLDLIMIKNEVLKIMNIVKKSYKVGARIGLYK